MHHCCICKKQIEGSDIFGTYYFPTCKKHHWEYSKKLSEIEAMGRGKKQGQAFSELVGLSTMPKDQARINELKKEINKWDDEIEFLEDDLWHYKNLIRDARDEIAKLEKKTKKTFIGAQQHGGG